MYTRSLDPSLTEGACAQPRQPEGIPSGGEFAAVQHGVPNTRLEVVAQPVSMSGLRPVQAEQVCNAYIRAAEWSSLVMTDEDGEGDANDAADEYELSPEAEGALRTEAAECWNGMPEDLRESLIDNDVDVTQWAHDMWLTRERHGVGFWDRADDVYGTPEIRQRLSEYAMESGEGGYFWLDDNDELLYERM